MEKERLKDIKCFLFDMDGTIYLGNALLPGVADFFKKLRDAGKDYYFVTNNSSKGHIHYAKKLIRMLLFSLWQVSFQHRLEHLLQVLS